MRLPQPWTRNVRTQRGFAPGDRLAIIDTYLRADAREAARLRRKLRVSPACVAQWALAYYGDGLRALRRQLGLPSVPRPRRASR